jgi:hypothetical protein
MRRPIIATLRGASNLSHACAWVNDSPASTTTADGVAMKKILLFLALGFARFVAPAIDLEKPADLQKLSW